MPLRRAIVSASLFAPLLSLLIFWAVHAEANISLPVYGHPLLGGLIAVIGLGLIFGATGLHILAIPLIFYGASMFAQSAAGLWLVSPVLLIICLALTPAVKRPLPAMDEGRPSVEMRIGFYLAVLVPWLLLYQLTAAMHLTGFAFALPFEQHLPIYPWTALIYESSYVTVALAPWNARTNADLRQLTISAWVASAVVFPVYWVFPSSAPRRLHNETSWMAHLLGSEQSALPPTAAFPSFHVLWAIFVGRLYRPYWLGALYAVAVAISCITTGMHYIPDVAASFAIAPLLLSPHRLWSWLLRCLRQINRLCRDRFMPALLIAACLQVAVATLAIGFDQREKVAITTLAGVLGGWVCRRVANPVFGIALAIALACAPFQGRWVLWGAHALAICLVAALMQCCVSKDEGSQLRMILGFLGLALLLLRLWRAGSPLSLICGVCVIGHALLMCVAEASHSSLPLASFRTAAASKWKEAAILAAGAAITTLSAPRA